MAEKIGSLVRKFLIGFMEDTEEKTVDYSDLASKFFGTLSEAEYEDYLLELLKEKVATEFGNLRNAAITNLKAEEKPVKGGTYQPPAQVFLSDDWVPPQKTKTSLTPAEQFFNHVVPVKVGVKKLGELTKDDLDFVAETRYGQAKALQTRADSYAALSELVTKYEAKVLKEVPYEEVKKVFVA